MLRKPVIALLILTFSEAVAGQPPKVKMAELKKPTAITPPVSFQLGPGDSIGFTYYDYGTNGSPNRNLINFGDGQISFARMCAVDVLDSGNATLGSYFKFFDGTSWSSDWTRVESVRRGWTNIDQIVDAGGIEAILTHGMEINFDAYRGANVWSDTTLPCLENTYPRLAIGDGFATHALAMDSLGNYAYHLSYDAGGIWSCGQVLWTHPGIVDGDPDAYDITAKGNKVAIVLAGASGDIVLVESMDNGTTWTETIIYDIDETLATPGEEVPDGSVTALYDSDGALHIAWGNFVSVGDGSLNFSVEAGIRHWSAATGVMEVAYPDPNPTLFVPGDPLPAYEGSGSRHGNLATEPDLSADANGGVLIVFNRIINERDAFGNFYQHIFLANSTDGGLTWMGPADITPGTGFDASFATVADLNSEFGPHFAYFCDPWAGNAVNAIHENIRVAIMYCGRDCYPYTNVQEIPGIPSETHLLYQNFPNPFNPSTEITFDLPVESHVVLSIHNVLGQEVDRLIDAPIGAGSHTVSWDATNRDGKRLASGIYFYRLHSTGERSQEFNAVRKMMLVR